MSYAAAHKGDLAFLAYDPKAPEQRLGWNADQPMPLASSRKIVILAAYARAVVGGELDPQQPVRLKDWEALYLPGLDGGAHASSLKVLGIVAKPDGTAKDRARSVPLDTLARFMIETSDNAAADALTLRLGEARLARAIRDLGLRGQDPIGPIAGMVLGWLDPAQADFVRLGPAARAAREWTLARALLDPRQNERIGARIRGRQDTPDQAALATATDVRGTSEDYAGLLARVLGNTLFGPRESELMRRHLSWPLRVNPQNAGVYRTLLAKGGELSGVLTENIAYTAKDGSGATISLFLRRVPQADQPWLRQNLDLITLSLAQNGTFAQKLSAALTR